MINLLLCVGLYVCFAIISFKKKLTRERKTALFCLGSDFDFYLAWNLASKLYDASCYYD